MPVSEVGAPSNEGWHPPMGNPGSAPVIGKGIVQTQCFANTMTPSIEFCSTSAGA